MIYILPKYLQPFIYKLIKWHYRKPRKIIKRGIEMLLLPTVFHPTFYLSTDIFLDFILSHNFENGNVLELGCGNGFISLFLAKNSNIHVFASDINPSAIEGIKINAAKNEIQLEAINSDLFQNIPDIFFDHILINPPYYKGKVNAVNEHAFFAGEELEYFEKLFGQMDVRRKKIGKTYFILSENAPVKMIFEIAAKYNFEALLIHEEVVKNESFEIYVIS